MEASHSLTTHPEVRIVLLGKTGVGKSASGNTILGANLFPSEQSSSSVTTACQKHSTTVANRTVTVVDTPDFFYATQSEDLSSEIKRSVDLASPGVHAFLYVLPLTTFTEQEADVVCVYERCFGEGALSYTVVLFTYGDQLDSVPLESVIEQNASLSEFINACDGRYCVLNNKLPSGSVVDSVQVMNLLRVIDSMIRSNGSRCYTGEMLEEAQRSAEEQLEMIRAEGHRQEEEKRRRHERDLQRATQETEERVRREENERWERERLKMQAEKESLQRKIREQIERQKKWKQNRHATDDKVDPEKCPKSKLKCLISILVIFAMGGIHVDNSGAERYKGFAHGCGIGAVSVISGLLSAEAWGVVRRKMLKCTLQSRFDKGVGVLFGFAAGAVTGQLMGAVGGGRYRLLAGAVGAYGAFCCRS